MCAAWLGLLRTDPPGKMILFWMEHGLESGYGGPLSIRYIRGSEPSSSICTTRTTSGFAGCEKNMAHDGIKSAILVDAVSMR